MTGSEYDNGIYMSIHFQCFLQVKSAKELCKNGTGKRKDVIKLTQKEK